jgi:hypothetical protein
MEFWNVLHLETVIYSQQVQEFWTELSRRISEVLEDFYVIVWKAELDKFGFDSGTVIALQHYHAIFRCPAGRETLFQFVSDLCQRSSGFW